MALQTEINVVWQKFIKDEHFKQQLVDAARSFKTGPAWQFRNKMGPLVNIPDQDLQRALTTLEPSDATL